MLSPNNPVQIAKEIAASAVPKRYILRSPNLNVLHSKMTLATPEIHSVSEAQALISATPIHLPISHDIEQDEDSLLSPVHQSLRAEQNVLHVSSDIDQSQKVFTAQPPYFITYGCHGEKSSKPKEVAKKFIDDIKKEISQGRTPPEFVLILGDNYYDFGIDKPDSNDFSALNMELFGELTKLNIPCFFILGNHDENLHRLNKFAPFTPKGIAQGLNQVAHSYLTTSKYTTAQLKELFGMESLKDKQDTIELELKNLPLFNMPNRYYSLDLGNTEVFCIDSNTYVRDYFEYQACKKNQLPIDPNNQAVWLERESARAKKEGKHLIFAQHHPLITPGKRAETTDSDVYLDLPDQPLSPTARELAEQKFPGLMKLCYSDLLKSIYEAQRLQPDAIIHAHDHNMYHIFRPISEKQPIAIKQYCFGGGGGHIQERYQCAALQSELGCHVDRHGVGEIVCDDKLKIRIHSTCDRFHIEFTSDRKEPTRTYIGSLEEQNEVKRFTNCIRSAIDEYFKKGLNGQAKGKNRAHDIWAYLCNKQADSLAQTVVTVTERAFKQYNMKPKVLSLMNLINEKLSQEYKTKYPKGVTLKEFAEPYLAIKNERWLKL